MARSRNIKPGFFANEDLVECDPLARILFIGLWCEADRRGILGDRPKRIKLSLLPADDCDVDALLGQLESRRFIRRYESGGAKCIKIANFSKHQNPHQIEKNSELPDESPELARADSDTTPRIIRDDSVSAPQQLREDSDASTRAASERSG